MIGKLSGRVDYKASDHVMLDVRGVGYMVYCSDRTLAVYRLSVRLLRFTRIYWCVKISCNCLALPLWSKRSGTDC